MNQLAHHSAVPHLITAQRGPLGCVERHFLQRQTQIEAWFRKYWSETPPPFYTSVDLRNAGYKIAPVDTNLFPAGFNNLNPAFMALCIQAAQDAIARINPRISRVLIVPENHTRNLFYLQSVAVLRALLEKAGFEVRIGSLLADLAAAQTIELPSARTVTLEPLLRQGEHLQVENFIPDLIVLNNDLSGGRPALLENLVQPITPSLSLGWSNRLKSTHFGHYREVVQSFSQAIDLDGWLIDPLFKNCGEVNFMDGSGMNCLQRRVGELLTDIQAKYDQYEITAKPFVMVKADAGTYGMGVMSVHSVDDVLALNRKERTRMSTSKEGQAIRNVIVQEGVYTQETWGEPAAVAEPVVYMIDRHVVGGFYRVHTERSQTENLNAPGMRFEPLDFAGHSNGDEMTEKWRDGRCFEPLMFAECCNSPEHCLGPEAPINRFYAYGVVARLALAAAAREVAAI